MDGLRPILLAQHVTAQLSLSCASPLSGHFGHGRDWSPTPIATVVGKSPSFQSSEKKQRPWQDGSCFRSYVICFSASERTNSFCIYCRLESYLLFVEWFFSVYRRSKIKFFMLSRWWNSTVFWFSSLFWGEMDPIRLWVEAPNFFCSHLFVQAMVFWYKKQHSLMRLLTGMTGILISRSTVGNESASSVFAEISASHVDGKDWT